MALLLREEDVAQLLPMAEAVEAVEDAFLRQGLGAATNKPRSRVRLPAGTLHTMAAGLPSQGVLGLKAYTSFGQGLHFVVLLYSAESGELLAVMEANHLGQLRTGAASGVATKHMARPNACRVGIVGSGGQARTQLLGVGAVRAIDRVTAFSRRQEPLREFCREMTHALEIEVIPATSAQAAIEGADIIVTATTAREPILRGEWLEPGVHINAVGSNYAIKREVDDDVVRRADMIVVDSREQAREESGDLLVPLARGVVLWEAIRELGEVVAGHIPGRRRDEDITLFKSHGIALEDVAAAARVYQKAKALGRGEFLRL